MTDIPGGYDWDTVLTIAERVLRKGCPGAPHSLADAAPSRRGVRQSRGRRRSADTTPMLTPGKLREISHPDWLCDSHDFAEATGWRAAVGLEQGLARAYGHAGSH